MRDVRRKHRTGRIEHPSDVTRAEAEVRGGLPGIRTANGSELDANAVETECVGDVSGDVLQTFLDVVGLEQRGRDVGQQRGLELAPCRVGRAPTRACGELADDDGGDDIDGEREPVRRVAQRECVLRREEEKIECEHRGDRYADRERHPKHNRGR